MRINFFEEYPTDENLERARLIDFPSTIFLATHSLHEFHQYKEKLLNINPTLEVAYWPILPHSYWISPFSNTTDLENFITEMKTNKDPLTILIDLELPLGKNRSLYFRNIFRLFKNKRIIENFFAEAKKYNIHIVTAEYPPINSLFIKLYRLLGVSYDVQKYGHRSCMMYYTSMVANKTICQYLAGNLVRIKNTLNPDLELGLGTIATGVLGDEPILSPEALAHDLVFMQENGFKTATIFRLGGLDDEYLEAINRYNK
jgi:hypothetical protein